MLLAQFIALLLSSAKRLDAVVLHARQSVRDVLSAVSLSRGNEADLG